uniref:Apurinic endonuclease-redox protein n=1 Tax=Lygus hesperus TaxID=30085 RepID=A0A0A9X5W6_LYGHE
MRGLLKKDAHAIEKLLTTLQPDMLCLQETKLNVHDAEANAKLGVVDGYHFVDHPCASTKGYSGTRVYVKNATFGGPYQAQTVCGFTFPAGVLREGTNSATRPEADSEDGNSSKNNKTSSSKDV